jgi:hypothetical protein
MKKYSLGIELELCDVPKDRPLPEGWTTSFDPDIMNHNGIAAALDYPLGIEFNSTPSYSLDEMMNKIKELFKRFPEARVNHKSVTHIHLSWEGAKEDLDSLKKILSYTNENGQWFIDNKWYFTILPEMGRNTKSFRSFDRKIMNELRYNHCMNAKTIKEFKEGHAVVSDGRILWQTTKRFSVNLYSLWTSGSIEFRWHHPSININDLQEMFLFDMEYLDQALSDRKPVKDWANNFNLPKEYPYDHELEKKWLLTNTKFNDMETVLKNRELILKGEL